VSDEHREIEIVSVGSGPPRAPRAAAPPRSAVERLLLLLTVGVFLVAAGTGFTAWTVYQQSQDNRELNCAYLTFPGDGEPRTYDKLEDYEKTIADAFDCDVKGR